MHLLLARTLAGSGAPERPGPIFLAAQHTAIMQASLVVTSEVSAEAHWAPCPPTGQKQSQADDVCNAWEEIMWRSLVSTVALALGAALAQPAGAQSGADLVKQSVAAQGGAAAVSSA